MTVADDARALAARSRAGQGLPDRITNPAVLARIAAVLLAAVNGESPAAGAGPSTPLTNRRRPRPEEAT